MRIIRILSVVALSLSMTLLLLIPNVSAQTTSADSAQGLQISPTRVELNVSRGNSYTIKLNVTNVTAADLFYTPSMSDFGAKDETGSPFLSSDLKLPATASIRSWVYGLSTFELKSRESKEILATVVVPDDAEPGGHYGALSFSSSAPELQGNGVGLSASTGMLILIRVDGAVNEEASLASFYTSKNDKQTSFFENSPITFVTRVKNSGNIHLKPIGAIEVRDAFGGLISKVSVNADESNVLPNSIRRFNSKYDKDWLIGYYTANLSLGYGEKGQAIISSVSFWVIPWKIVAAVVAVSVTIIYILSRLIRVYNKHIIKKSKNENKNTKNNQGKN